MRLALYVRTSRGAAVLGAAIDAFANVAYVVTADDPTMPDDGTDRIRDLCAHADIPCFDRAPLHAVATHRIAAGWRSLLDVPNLVVMHDSLLPRYRGWSPLIAALVNGDRRLGVTAILAEGASEFDVGPIVGQQEIQIDYPIRIAEALERIVPLYSTLTQQILAEWPTAGRPQHEAAATYSVWRDQDDYRIDWTQDAARIRRHIDATTHPYAGASALLNGCLVRIIEAQEESDVTVEDRHVGKVLFVRDRHPVVICGTGLLRLTDVRDESGRPLVTLASIRTRFA